MGATPILRLAEVSRVHGTDSTAVRALAGVCMEVNAGQLSPVTPPAPWREPASNWHCHLRHRSLQETG